MNNTNRVTSINNSDRVEYSYNVPIASSDLNEIQSIISNKFLPLKGFIGTGVQLKWQRKSNNSITIPSFFLNYTTNDNKSIQVAVPSCDISVGSVTNSPSNRYQLDLFYRYREINSQSQIYKNGIRSSGYLTVSGPTVFPSDLIIPNNIFDPLLQEEVSTRVVIEFTFVLQPVGSSLIPTNTTDGAWTKVVIRNLNSTQISPILNLNLSEGYIGFVDNINSKVFDYAIISNTNLLPSNSVEYDQYALVLSSKGILRKVANSSTWSLISSSPSLFNINSYVIVNEFLEGTSADNRNCVGCSGYVIFDQYDQNRIILNNACSISDTVIIYPEYEITTDENDNKYSTLINHSIIAPTFFSEDPASSTMYDDPDGDYLLCTTIDNQIYFRNIFKTN